MELDTTNVTLKMIPLNVFLQLMFLCLSKPTKFFDELIRVLGVDVF